MSNEVIEQKIRELGFCCTYAYLIAVRSYPSRKVKDELNCSISAVNKYRQKTHVCQKNSKCLKVTPEPARRPERSPDRASSVDLLLPGESSELKSE